MTMRVAVTTTADAAYRISGPLETAGLQPVELPCIRIRFADPPVLERLRWLAGDADVLLFTSARAVRALWPDGGMPAVPAAVVGSATAEAVRAAGGTVDVVGSGGGDELVDELVETSAGRRIVFPRARSSDPSRADRLRLAGAEVYTHVAYETVPIAPGPDPVDAALFGSPSAVEGWRLSRDLDEPGIVAAMGETTAAALDEAGRVADIVPERPSVQALVDALADRQEVTS